MRRTNFGKKIEKCSCVAVRLSTCCLLLTYTYCINFIHTRSILCFSSEYYMADRIYAPVRRIISSCQVMWQGLNACQWIVIHCKSNSLTCIWIWFTLFSKYNYSVFLFKLGNNMVDPGTSYPVPVHATFFPKISYLLGEQNNRLVSQNTDRA